MNGGDGEDNEDGDDDRDGSLDEIYQAALDRETDWAKRKDEIKSELLGESRGTENEVEKKIDRAIRTDEKHDEMLTAVASAFNKRSRLAHESGWYILGLEPLYEIDPNMRNPDALLGHDDRDFVVTVEAKTGISKPQNALQQIRDARENVLDHRDYLANQTGHLFEDAEMVLMVPGEKSNSRSERLTPRRVWQLRKNPFSSGRTIPSARSGCVYTGTSKSDSERNQLMIAVFPII